MSIQLALADAAKNCTERGATAIVTLKSGVQFEGKLERKTVVGMNTSHMQMDHGGWATIDDDEVAVVEARP